MFIFTYKVNLKTIIMPRRLTTQEFIEKAK